MDDFQRAQETFVAKDHDPLTSHPAGALLPSHAWSFQGKIDFGFQRFHLLAPYGLRVQREQNGSFSKALW
jgi:hypothetical protein